MAESRFFRAAGDTDTESESEEEELLLSDEEEEEEEVPEQAAKPKLTGMARFLRGAGSSGSSSSSSESEEESSDEDDDEKPKGRRGAFGEGESSDEEKTVVKSARDKRVEEMEACGKSIDNALKVGDWNSVGNEFDKLGRLVERQRNLQEPVPTLYVRQMVNLDKSIANAAAKDKDAKKKMNAAASRALATLKQKVKRSLKDNEEDIKAFNEDADAFEAKYQAAVAASAPAVKPTKVVKPVTGEEEGEDENFTTVGKAGKAYNFTASSVLKNLAAVHESRGRKNTDRVENINILQKLLEVAETPYSRISVLLALIAARFDYNTAVSAFMPVEMWLSTQKNVDELISVVASNPDYVVQEVVTVEYDPLEERTPLTENGPVLIRGSIISSLDRLDEEFTKSLQNIDPHGTEYVDRLKHSMGLYKTICCAQLYFVSKNHSDAIARAIMRRVEQIYSKPDAVVQALENGAAPALADLKLSVTIPTLAACESTQNLVHTLCVKLYNTDNSFLRTRAILCHIYHYAFHNEFYTARDMLFMSRLGDSIHNADVGTQVLYNRAVVQLGLCAFRIGLIKEAHSALHDIFATQRVKELLAQGMHQQKYGSTMTAEQERAERARQLPFHLHINTELLEAAFLVSSMLVEIPLLASIDNEEAKRKAVSKPFRRLLDFADRQVFTGPPESTRDHIMQASKALQDGQWEKARDLILGIKIWSLMPEEKSVKEMLGRRIQEEGLRTYLFTNSAYYTTLSIPLLAATFSLTPKAVTSIISRMIWSDELSASLDYVPSTFDGASAGEKLPVVIFHRVELTRLQQLAQTLADKVNTLVENNEKALDAKLGGSGDARGGTWAEGERKPGGGGEGEGGRRTERASRGGRGGRGGLSGRGGRFSQGLGNRMDGASTRRAQ
ncbi:Translation initiation factor 3 subunit c [Tulasnella sp. 424]|nr:Translation initiation factor 3 subunit c [Tulasnella sp. 424]